MLALERVQRRVWAQMVLVVAPQEIHIGVTTVVLGVPVLLVLLRRKAVSL